MAKDFFEHARNTFPPAILEKAQVRYRELRREMLLRELREVMRVPQGKVAKTAGIRQSNLSRLEKQSDMQITTLKKIVTALGGKLEIIARFKDADVKIVLPSAG